jgi:hypothetical protein
MSSNLENDGLVGLRNNDLNRDGLPMVVDDDNYEIMCEGKMYHSYEDYVKAKRSQTAGIFANSGMLAVRLAIAEEMTAPGPRRAKYPCDDVAMPPLLHQQSEGSDLAATMQSSTPGAGLRGVITDGSSSMTTSRSSPLSRPGGTDGSSPSGNLLVSSGKGGDDREDGANLVPPGSPPNATTTETTTTMTSGWSAAAIASSNDVFIRSIRLYPRGRQSLVTSCLMLQKTSNQRKPSIGFRHCALTMKSLLLLAREVSMD